MQLLDAVKSLVALAAHSTPAALERLDPHIGTREVAERGCDDVHSPEYAHERPEL